MRKLLTTLLPYRNSLIHSNLRKNNLLPSYYSLTTFARIRVFIYNVYSIDYIYV